MRDEPGVGARERRRDAIGVGAGSLVDERRHQFAEQERALFVVVPVVEHVDRLDTAISDTANGDRVAEWPRIDRCPHRRRTGADRRGVPTVTVDGVDVPTPRSSSVTVTVTS